VCSLECFLVARRGRRRLIERWKPERVRKKGPTLIPYTPNAYTLYRMHLRSNVCIPLGVNPSISLSIYLYLSRVNPSSRQPRARFSLYMYMYIYIHISTYHYLSIYSIYVYVDDALEVECVYIPISISTYLSIYIYQSIHLFTSTSTDL